jgi:hypothetical protein
MVAADNDSMQDWMVNYDREGQELAANKNGINICIRLNMKLAWQLSDA